MSRLSDVFGVSNSIIESYVERDDVDGSFLDALERKKQIVVYGSSKQGKSSLVKKHLKPESTIQYQAAATTELIDIYSSILRQSGVQILTDSSVQESRGG